MADTGACSVTRVPMGAKKCISSNPIKMMKKPFLLVPGFTFDTFADFQDKSVWNAGIAAGNIYPLEKVEAVEDTSTEAKVVETDGGSKFKTSDGNYGFIVDMNLTPDQNKNIQDYDQAAWTIIYTDDDDNLIAKTPDDIVVGGMEISYLNVMPMKLTLSSDDYSKTRVEFQLKYNRDLNQDVCIALGSELDWSPVQLEPVTIVTVTDVSIASNVITGSFYIVASRIAGLPSVAVTDITADNMIFIDQVPAVVVADTLTMTTTPGIWDFDMTAAAMTSGTMELVATADSLFASDVIAVTV